MDRHPPASSELTRRRMLNTPTRDTPAELAIRRELHRRGLRYFVDRKVAGVGRRRPDIVFPRLQIAVFVDGCYWHACPEHGSVPKVNTEWWRRKFDTTVARDRDTDEILRAAGWLVLRFWEHDQAIAAANAIEQAVRERREQR